jgi:dynein heavy chain, axonemal
LRLIASLIRYYDEPDFVPEVVEKVSLACKSLCLWCRAMKIYNDVASVIEPKRQALATAQATLDAEKLKLEVVERALAAVVKKVDDLQAECDVTLAEKARLQQAADTTARRLLTADKLTSGLAEESSRWTVTAETLRERLGGLTGSVFVCSAFVAYAGPFTAAYRRRLLDDWTGRCLECGLRATPMPKTAPEPPPSADDPSREDRGEGAVPSTMSADPMAISFDLVGTMGDPVLIRQWQQWGLPIDDYSAENALLATVGKRWPLAIDPQAQANKWIRAMEQASRQLTVCRPGEKHLLKSLESSIRSGAVRLRGGALSMITCIRMATLGNQSVPPPPSMIATSTPHLPQ